MTKEQRIWGICVQKVQIHKRRMQDVPFDFGQCTDGDYYGVKPANDLYNRWNWVSSFVTGLAPIVYQVSRDSSLLHWANSMKNHYSSKVFKTPLSSMHDLGFLYMPYSVHMWKLTGDAQHKEIALKAADELIKRFDIHDRFIEAWSRMEEDKKDRTMIADTLMNLPLLFWAWQESRHTVYRDIAAAHVEAAIEHIIRKDFSIAHGYRYLKPYGSGEEYNACGYGVGSYWARGASWVIYGLAIAGKYTANAAYTDLAVKVAERFISELTEDDFIPVWDFRLPKDKPGMFCKPENERTNWDQTQAGNKKYNRDTSAAAVCVCAFDLIYALTGNQGIKQAADKMMDSLCERYVDERPDIPGVLKCSNGNMTYNIYGDYYFIQALAERLHGIAPCWV